MDKKDSDKQDAGKKDSDKEDFDEKDSDKTNWKNMMIRVWKIYISQIDSLCREGMSPCQKLHFLKNIMTQNSR